MIDSPLPIVDVARWQTRQAIVFDWNDGPRHGICAMSYPRTEFVFDLLAQRFNPEGLDDRLFRIRDLPLGTVDSVVSRISVLGNPATPIWIPVWRFASDEERQEVDREIDAILSESKPTTVLIRSQDLTTFEGCWQFESMPTGDIDWFAFLGIT